MVEGMDSLGKLMALLMDFWISPPTQMHKASGEGESGAQSRRGGDFSLSRMVPVRYPYTSTISACLSLLSDCCRKLFRGVKGIYLMTLGQHIGSGT